MRVLVVHPGASWSTADVEAGLTYGLKQHGVEVIPYRLDERLDKAGSEVFYRWRQQRRGRPDLPKPDGSMVVYQASEPALAMALRHQVDAVVVVCGMFFHRDVIVMLKRAGVPVTVLFTESPYDAEKELGMASIVDGCWTNERSVLDDFRKVNKRAGYLPHGWHPERHIPSAAIDDDAPAHDVVFVGSGFPERITWFNAIDWTGIDLGLYGTWKGLGLKRQVAKCIKGAQVNNTYASSLYRRAKVGLNLYRRSKGFGLDRSNPRISHAESLSPRAYELAACGAFHLSDYRTEVPEQFGSLVPTFQTPQEAEQLIRQWLRDDEQRARVAEALPASVAEASWVDRARVVIGDLQALLLENAA